MMLLRFFLCIKDMKYIRGATQDYNHFSPTDHDRKIEADTKIGQAV